MQVLRIKDIDDPRLDIYARLTEAQLRNKLHREQGVFICESLKVIRIAIENNIEPISFLCEEKFIESVPDMGVPVYTAEREILHSITGYELSRGIICAMRRPIEKPADEILRTGRNVAVLDGIVNSENTGAIFRAAAALGIDALLLTHTCCDPYNRRACRVSMGTIFQLPWGYFDTYQQIKEAQFTTIAMALTDNSVPIDHPSLKQAEKKAIILGSEGYGLPQTVIDEADQRARILMHRGVDSINVAAAAAVAFFELTKKG